jgi:hypothetical protein
MHPRFVEMAVIALAATSLGLLAALAWSGSVRAALTLQGHCATAVAPSSAIVGAIVALAALFWLSRRRLVEGG